MIVMEGLMMRFDLSVVIGLSVVLALVAALSFQSFQLQREREAHETTKDQLELVEGQLRAAEVNRKHLGRLEKDQRVLATEVDKAVAASETLEDAIDHIERMEGR
nr:hypothetical protein [Brevundimonas naejangsanensis]